MHCCQRQTIAPMFPNESYISDSNAFDEDNKDNVAGCVHDQVTFPTDQVPDIKTLDKMAAEAHKSDLPVGGSSPQVFFSLSVITSSSCVVAEAATPSCVLQAAPHPAADQGSSEECASNPGSSNSSNSLSERTLHGPLARSSPPPTTTISVNTTASRATSAPARDPAHSRPADIPRPTAINPPLSFKSSNKDNTNQHNYASVARTHAIGKPLDNAGWGIAPGSGLRGGGESSLTTGTQSWGAPAGGGSGGATGWGGAPGGQGAGAVPPSQWGGGARGAGAGVGGVASAAPSGASQGAAGQLTAGLEGSGSLMDLSVAGSASSGGGSAKSPPAAPPSSGSPGGTTAAPNSSTWAQAAGKGLPAAPATPVPAGGATPAAGTQSTKQQLEQLNTMREALFSQDGWGGQHVNQDSNWDIPSSPEPGVTKDGIPVWKPNCNNVGTDLWEANLRNGGQPPPAVAKTPWGHTPTSNIGGTWGEDDDPAVDAGNVWTGVPSQGGPGGGGPPPPQWAAAQNQGGMWPGQKKDNDWGSGGGSNWGDPRGDLRGGGMDPRGPMDSRDMRGQDPRDMRGGGMMGDPRDHMRGGPMPDMRGGNGGGGGGNDGMMRGDPRGISGRLNGANDGMWGGAGPNQPGPHHQHPHPGVGPGGKMPGQPQGVSQWPGPPPKDMMAGGGGKPSGWEESSPPQQRRNIPNYDDGTSLWGGQPQQARGGGGGGGGMGAGPGVSHWKEMPTPGNMGRGGGPGGMNCPPGMPQNRGLPNSGPGMKPDGNPLWMGPPRNGSWGDGPHDPNAVGNWGEEPKGPPMGGGGGGNSWGADPQLTPNSWGGPKQMKNAPGQWGGDNGGGNDMGGGDPGSWGHQPNKQGPKQLTKELVWASKQFRILAEMGYKKDDVEGALRTTNMNLEDAIELLREPWQRHNEQGGGGFDHQGGGFPGQQRFNPSLPQPMSFAPPGPGNNALLGNNGNPSLANMSPAIVQKILTQQPPPQPPSSAGQPAGGFGGGTGQRQQSNQPSTAQLRMLVQQIQMAVQAGYLNHQILNQPLAPQTLLLLNQLLQQIKVLQQLMQQQSLAHVPPLKGNSNAVLHISVQITKTKQQISNLQNQIASQQAIYVKQQQQQQPADNFFPPARPDPLSLQGNFEQLNLNARDPQVPGGSFNQSQQSRLNQWKLPSLDKEGEGNEFSRAPGTTSKPSLPQSHSSPNMNPLQLGQGDGTWSTVSRSNSDTGWPESADGKAQDAGWPVSQAASAFTDLVPEFEPGKPWKGTQMKNSDDDPSITPGSVGRPLSLSSIKDSESFSGNKSPTSSIDTPIPPLSLSSSTWSFNPPAATGYPGSGKPGKNTWGEAPPPSAVTSELWEAPKARGPPPGLNKNTPAAGTPSSANGWGGIGGGLVGGRNTWGGGAQGTGGGGGGAWGSSWLILKNLTPQIDGSTLKTLCVQHGPLQNFHLYLNHGLALAKYNTREEANKAQGALNNCVLVNTTIFAESPADSEVHAMLQHLGHGAQQSQSQQQQPSNNAQSAAWRVGPAPKAGGGGETWGVGGGGSQLWPSTTASSLWADSNQEQHRATPSSLNSFLPGDLLGGESM